jgi:hypothetical protein
MRWLWVVLVAGYSASVLSDEIKVVLGGDNEIPPLTSSASGIGTITVRPDKSVSGSVTVAGMTVTVAHIHEAPPDRNGPIVIPLTKVSDNTWSVPPGVVLTDAQYESYKAGNLYFNIHSQTHRAGEVRGQIRP